MIGRRFSKYSHMYASLALKEFLRTVVTSLLLAGLIVLCVAVLSVAQAPPLPRETYGSSYPTRQFFPDLIDNLTYLRTSTAVNVQECGAVVDGVILDTTALLNCLNTYPYVVIPAGVLKTAAFSIPAGHRLELLPGALLLLTGSLTMNGDQSSLIGSVYSIGVTSFGTNIRWAGATNTPMLLLGHGVSANGMYLHGLSLDGAGIAGVTGMMIGGLANSGFSWFHMADIWIRDVFHCLDIVSGSQQGHLTDFHCRNTIPSAGVAFRFGGNAVDGDFPRATIAALFLDRFTSEFFQYGLVVGGPVQATASGCAMCVFSHGVIESLPVNGIGVDLQRGQALTLEKTFFEGLNNSTQRALRLGTAMSLPEQVRIVANYFQGFGVVAEGIGWDSLRITENTFDTSAAAPYQAFLNMGGGPRRRDGQYYGNMVRYSISQTSAQELTSRTGFTRVELANNNPATNALRTRLNPGASTETVANNGILQLVPADYRGLLSIFDASNHFSLVTIRGATNPPEILFDTSVV